MFKCGFVGVVGKPNAGKSTLVNKLVGYKVSITTPKPQTTRFNVKGIITDDTSQIIFVDTPGIHREKTKLNKYMMNSVSQATQDVDLIVYMIDATKHRLDEISEEILKNIVGLKKKVILCINKIDKVKKDEVFRVIGIYDEYIKKLNSNFCEVIPISVFKNTNLDVLVECIKKYLPEGDMIYAADEITDATEKEIVEEIVREKALNNLNEEIPHGINVQVESFKERKNREDEDIYDIDVNIICEKDSHKPIIIGKDGGMLKKIASQARYDIEKQLDTKVNLKMWVKVRPDWQENDNFLANINKSE